MVQYLIQNNNNNDYDDNDDDDEFYHYPSNSLQLVKRSFWGRTPLHWAAQNVHLNAVACLVKDCDDGPKIPPVGPNESPNLLLK